MDLRHEPKSSTTQAAAGKRSATTTLVSKGPRRLAFRIRQRGLTFGGSLSLLIINHLGVWSFTHRRYIRKTRLLRLLKLDIVLCRTVEKVKRYKMWQWMQYKQDEELRCLRWKVTDLFWSLLPEEDKMTIVLFYRHRQQQQQQQQQERLNCFTAAVVLVAVKGFMLLNLMLRGCFNLRLSLFLGLGYLALVFLLDMVAKGYGL